jgi:hypothetical protein
MAVGMGANLQGPQMIGNPDETLGVTLNADTMIGWTVLINLRIKTSRELND